MDILVPIDASDCSERALRFAAEMAERYEGSLHVVHVTDVENEATEAIIERAEAILEEEGVADTPEVEIDAALSFQPADRVGKNILELVADRGYDHVVMGHHGAGTVGRAILGSAAQTVVQANTVPVTVVP
jgi:nucleotide-binding universal stress UspA family protein